MAPKKSSTKTQKRSNRTIYVEFGEEEKYSSLLQSATAYLSAIVGFLITIGASLRHKKNCVGGLELTRHSHYERRNGITIWRVECKKCGAVFTVLPHFIIRYKDIKIAEAEKALICLLGGLSFENTANVLPISG